MQVQLKNGEAAMIIHQQRIVISGNKSTTNKIGRICRLRLASVCWRVALALLSVGGFLLKYCFIGPAGMRRIWKCADVLENYAERLRQRPFRR